MVPFSGGCDSAGKCGVTGGRTRVACGISQEALRIIGQSGSHYRNTIKLHNGDAQTICAQTYIYIYILYNIGIRICIYVWSETEYRIHYFIEFVLHIVRILLYKVNSILHPLFYRSAETFVSPRKRGSDFSGN